jgi:hypothetical protein
MARPSYETERDRQNELEVAKVVCDLWGLTYVKMKPFYEVDFALMRFKDVKAVLEVRCRRQTYEQLDQWGGIFMSIHKWTAFKRWHDELPLTAIFAIRLLDGIYALIMKEGEAFAGWEPVKLTLGGSNNPRDEWDIEPLIKIPMKMFRKIADVETVPEEGARPDPDVDQTDS